MHTAQTFKNLVSLSWHYRGEYATPVDAYKGFLLRAALGRHGRKLLPQKEVQINLPGSSDPLWLRRTTSDFQIFMGLFEEHEYDAVAKLSLKPEPTIFDFGANIGLATRKMSMFFPSVRFLAVEPDAENRKMLAKNNQSLLTKGKLEVVGGFVAPADGVAAIDRSDGVASMFRMRVPAETEAELIQCFTVETLMKKIGATWIDLLKVDIEGAESQLFGACGGWISNVGAVIVEVDPPYTHELLIADLDRAGWKSEVVECKHSVICLRRV